LRSHRVFSPHSSFTALSSPPQDHPDLATTCRQRFTTNLNVITFFVLILTTLVFNNTTQAKTPVHAATKRKTCLSAARYMALFCKHRRPVFFVVLLFELCPLLSSLTTFISSSSHRIGSSFAIRKYHSSRYQRPITDFFLSFSRPASEDWHAMSLETLSRLLVGGPKARPALLVALDLRQRYGTVLVKSHLDLKLICYFPVCPEGSAAKAAV